MTTYRGEDMLGDDGFGTTEHALKSAHDALWAIANMQVQEETDKGEVLALCMSIARLELEKCSIVSLGGPRLAARKTSDTKEIRQCEKAMKTTSLICACRRWTAMLT